MVAFLPDPTVDASRIAKALTLSIQGWNDVTANEPDLPAVLGIACDAGNPVQRSAVAEAGISVVIAATGTAELALVLASSGSDAVVFAPFAEAPALPNLVADPLTNLVACRPNHSETAAARVAVMSRLASRATDEAQRATPVIALSQNERLFGYDLLTGMAALNEGPTFDTFTYDWQETGAQLVLAMTRVVEGRVLLVGPSNEEDWATNITAVETNDYWDGEAQPYYLVMDRRTGLLIESQQRGGQTALHDRIVFLDYHREPRHAEVSLRFKQSFEESQHEAFGPELDYIQDCFYLAGYAAVAAHLRYAVPPQSLSAKAILVGLSATVAGEVHAVGPESLAAGHAALDASKGSEGTLDLVGGSGDLDLVGLHSAEDTILSSLGSYVAPATAALELFCNDGNRRFCETGVIISPSGEFGGENRCPCVVLP